MVPAVERQQNSRILNDEGVPSFQSVVQLLAEPSDLSCERVDFTRATNR